MDAVRYQRAAKLFEEAMATPPEGGARHELIARAAAGDEALAAQVHRMVRYAERPPTASAATAAFLGRDNGSGRDAWGGDSQVEPDAPNPSAALIGVNIGHYRIVELIGEGGFGAVYRAEQEHPVRRTVALKVLKAGMDSRQVIARFEAERQALAVMEHPGIARVFDAGQTGPEQGARPFFVMELVSGETITDFCDSRRLDLSARLKLFINVCQAVQHAHHKGIIHRDLKPSNILVTEVDGIPSVKIIDFGIAKAVHQPLIEHAMVTQRLELLGTPQYMSPEQADGGADARGGAAIDTRSDTFSLGVVLYELLTGSTPLDSAAVQSATYSRLQAMIRDQRPERPSTRLTRLGAAGRDVAEARSAEIVSLKRRLRGDLDWIVLKALDPDRERRYDSAGAFADDIQRHLDDRPVLAGPPTAAYRVRKFARRHRLGVAAASMIALTILAGAVVVVMAMFRVRDSADQALAVNEFMSEVLMSASPDRGGAEVRLAEVLRTASANASQRFAGHPEIEAQVRDLLGRVFLNLDMSAQATGELKQAADLLHAVHGPDDRRTLEAQLSYVKGLLHEENGREAERVLSELIPRLERAVGPNDPMALEAQRFTGAVHKLRGRYKEAEETLRAVRQRATAIGADDATHIHVLDTLIEAMGARLGGMESDRRIRAEIETLAREMMERSTRLLGPGATPTIRARIFLAKMMLDRGDAKAAAEACRMVLALSQERLGPCHGQRQLAMHVLAEATNRLGDPAAAADLRLQLIECTRSQPTGAFNLVVRISDSLQYLDRGGRWVEGEALAREFAAALRDLGGGHGDMGFNGDLYLARFVSLQGRLDEAEEMYQSLLAREDETWPDSSARARLHLFYGSHLAQRGLYEEAERELQVAAGILDDIRRGTTRANPDDVIVEFIALYQKWGKPEQVSEYERLRAEALTALNAEP